VTDQTEARWRGRRYSLETRAKMSAAAKRRARSPHSPATRAKISAATRGKRGPQSAEQCKNIREQPWAQVHRRARRQNGGGQARQNPPRGTPCKDSRGRAGALGTNEGRGGEGSGAQ
jgi:hypothetical protein